MKEGKDKGWRRGEGREREKRRRMLEGRIENGREREREKSDGVEAEVRKREEKRKPIKRGQRRIKEREREKMRKLGTQEGETGAE